MKPTYEVWIHYDKSNWCVETLVVSKQRADNDKINYHRRKRVAHAPCHSIMWGVVFPRQYCKFMFSQMMTNHCNMFIPNHEFSSFLSEILFLYDLNICENAEENVIWFCRIMESFAGFLFRAQNYVNCLFFKLMYMVQYCHVEFMWIYYTYYH